MRKYALLLATLVTLGGCDSLASRLSPPRDAAQPPPPPPPAPTPPPPPADPVAAAGLEKISFTINGPLEEAIRNTPAADVAPALSQVTARLLVWWVDVARGLRKGDSADLVFQRIPGKEPLVHALRFTSGKHGRDFHAYLHQPEGARFTRYYDAAGEEVEERIHNSPIDDYDQVTSMLRDGRKHKGVDFRAPVGTPVKVPFDATLSRKNWSWKGNGNCLEFHDAQGRRIVFLHLDVIPKTLVPGQRFKAGQVVASSGNSGRSTAPHLHYQLEAPNGKLLDPFKVHSTYRAKLDAAQLPTFLAAKEKLDRMLTFVPGQLPAVAAPATAEPTPAAPTPAPTLEPAPAAAPADPGAAAVPEPGAAAPAGAPAAP